MKGRFYVVIAGIVIHGLLDIRLEIKHYIKSLNKALVNFHLLLNQFFKFRIFVLSKCNFVMYFSV